MKTILDKVSSFSKQLSMYRDTVDGKKPKEKFDKLIELFSEIKGDVELDHQKETVAVEHYQSLVNLLPEIIFEVDQTGNLMFLNLFGVEKLGLSQSELKNGKINISKVIHPDDLQDARNVIFGNLSGKRITGKEYRLISGSGTIIFTQIFNTPIVNNNKVVGLRGIAVDITERRMIEMRLKESVKKYQGIFNNSPIGIGYYSKDGILEECNSKFANMLGNSPEELKGFNIFRDMQDKSLLETLKKALIDGASSFEGVYKAVITGREAPARVMAQGMRNDKGEIYGGIVLAEDISERVKAENTLKASEEKFRSLVKNMGEGVGITDEKDCFLFANSAAENIFGVESGGLVNKSLKEFISIEDYNRMALETQKRKKGQKSNYELAIIGYDGHAKDLLITVTPNNDELGNYINSFGIFRDITTRKQIERELKDAHETLLLNNRELKIAKEKAEESDKLKLAFLTTMSHELRTPLNSIIGLSALIDNTMTQQEIEDFAYQINKSGNSLLDIIEDIFHVIQLEAGNSQPCIEEFELIEVLSEIHNNALEITQNYNKESLEIYPIYPLESERMLITTDKIMLKKLFMNLLNNAIKFSEEGEVQFGVRITHQQNMIFFVEDSGVGIPADKKHLLFERFRQIDQRLKRKYGGIGLGLYYSKKIIELLGGKIWYESTVGKGTTFYFSINHI